MKDEFNTTCRELIKKYFEEDLTDADIILVCGNKTSNKYNYVYSVETIGSYFFKFTKQPLENFILMKVYENKEEKEMEV